MAKGKHIYSVRRIISRQFRGRESICHQNPAFGSIGWAVGVGKESARKIRSIRAAGAARQFGGYEKAREYYSFYSDGRSTQGAAVRAVNTVARIGNPKPYILRGRSILALDFMKSMDARAPVYTAMR